MFRNYIKIAWRSLVSDSWYSALNIVGLAVGFICLLFIVFYIVDEYSYDRFFADSDRIYRVNVLTINNEGQQEAVAGSPKTMAYTLNSDLPEVEEATVLIPNREQLVAFRDKRFYESRLYQADSNFFDVFEFRFLAGSKNTALSNPNEIILTQTAATKYFGTEDPIGKPVFLETIGDYTVSAVVEDVPANSHFHFDMLIPLRMYEPLESYEWGNNNYYTYLKLSEQADASQMPDRIQKLGAIYKPTSNDRYSIFPLRDIHLSDLGLLGEIERGGSKASLGMLAIIAALAMLLAGINYVNLSTAKATKRVKEVGVRKTSGADKSSLVFQFLSESIILTLLSFGLAVLLMSLLRDSFNSISGKELILFSSQNTWIWVSLVGISLLIGLLAGIYPAFILSNLNPVKALKGQLSQIKVNSAYWVRIGLLGIQFTIAIGLIFGTLVIYSQLDFIQTSELGYDKEQVIVLPNVRAVSNKEVLKQQLASISNVAHVGASTSSIGMPTWTGNIRTQQSEADHLINFSQVDYGFIDALGMDLIAGRNFSPTIASDTVSSIIINQKAVQDLGLTEPIVGQRLIWEQRADGEMIYAEIVGVVGDFHYDSFHEPIKPFAFLVRNWFFVADDFMSKMFIKTGSGDLLSTLAQVENVWNEMVPDGPFTYYFLDDAFDQMYVSEMRFRTLFSWLTLIAIFIASLGLFGLVSYQVERRTKEIGIRKVLGASIASIVVLISRDFLLPIVISIFIASPLAWYVMDGWLQDFAYRIELQSWMLIISGVIALILAVIAISFQSIRASMVNPVKSLKTE